MPTSSPPRIVSLLPSATEIVNVLGLLPFLVGRSHECDYPEGVKDLPICTEPKFDPEGTSRAVHDRVTAILASALSVYRVKTEVLEALQPTHILTQAQCEVCAVSLSDVEAAVGQWVHSRPSIISLQPNTLNAVWQDIRSVAIELGVSADSALESISQRLEHCQQQATRSMPTVACIEWIDPPMAAGNWIPELVQLAGGKNLFGTVGQHSPWLNTEALVAGDPDVIIFMPCGYGLAKTIEEVQPLQQDPTWLALKAFRQGQVFVTNGNAYFNRPGPRLMDSLEILVEILHPGVAYGYEGTAWQRLPTGVNSP